MLGDDFIEIIRSSGAEINVVQMRNVFGFKREVHKKYLAVVNEPCRSGVVGRFRQIGIMICSKDKFYESCLKQNVISS
jgi:hypothetical protein